MLRLPLRTSLATKDNAIILFSVYINRLIFFGSILKIKTRIDTSKALPILPNSKTTIHLQKKEGSLRRAVHYQEFD